MVFFDILNLMVSAGADKADVNRFGGTALLPAAEKGFLRTVQVCLDAGVPVNHVNYLGWSALLEAVILGNGGRLYTDVIEELINAGANIGLADRKHLTAVQHAEALGQDKVVRMLKGEKIEQSAEMIQAKASAKKNEFEKALELMTQALHKTPDNPDFLFYSGHFLMVLKRYKEAMNRFEKALTGHPQASEFYFYIANCLRSLKQPDRALAMFEEGAAKGDSIFFWYHQSNYLRELGRHEEAVTVMEKLLDMQPDRYDFAFHLANSLRALGRHQEAIDAIEMAIAADPDNPLYHNHKEESLKLQEEKQ
ncbi:tetratricopeptide repeat protein [Virgibacillus halophilus]|uniref:Tetratricopeptide repeat protein n=1 Tax=Tigheibacillus halophilus TaxID=361280 RepID=A0ABU5C5Z8_9BACI|nr:tetratricopeptide repeat protein [Virgibacillus halophilus]